jgi:nicotinamidase-related amidase
MESQDKPALLLIDIQKGFEDLAYWGGERNNFNAEQNARILLDFWRINDFPVFHIKHCSQNPHSVLAEGKPGNEFQDIVKPQGNEPVIRKDVNSAFIGTGLKERLDDTGIKTVVIAGLTTDHCISTSARMSGNFGFKTFIISDATATFDKTGHDGKVFPAGLVHEIALASLHNEFGIVLSTNEMISLLSR